MAAFVMFLGSCVGLWGPKTPPPTPEPPVEAPPPPQRVTELASAHAVAVGDILMHGAVTRAAADHDDLVEGVSFNNNGYDYLFEGVRGRISEADLAFANLETPVSPSGTRRRSMVFNTEAALVDALHTAGFDLVSLANNHIYDQGRLGLVETITVLDDRDLDYIGVGTSCAEARRARILDINGIRVGWMAMTELFNDYLNEDEDSPCAFLQDLDQALLEVAAAREAGAEIVVMSLHWGDEYEVQPAPRHVEAAETLILGGVDLILGHHAHVVQPIEAIPTPDGRIGVVVYGMGNFVSNQSAWFVPGLHEPEKADPRDGLMVHFRFVRRQFGEGSTAVVRAEVADLKAEPLWTENNASERRRRRTTDIRVMPTFDRIAALGRALENAGDEADVVRLNRELSLMEDRIARVEGIVGAGWVLRPAEADPGG